MAAASYLFAVDAAMGDVDGDEASVCQSGSTINLYETGGHAFGVRKKGMGTDQWIGDALDWMKEIKIL